MVLERQNIMMLAGPAFVLLWWQAAARRYLRMEHSWAVAGAVAVLALVGGLALMLVTGPDFLEYVIARLGLA